MFRCGWWYAVDNITIDGTEIDLSSGDLTLDVAGSIVLNADSGSINLADDSTTFAELINSSSDFVVKSSQNDKDIIFKGVDNSSLITALTLDMSAAGNAIFNNDVTVGNDINLLSDGAVIYFGADKDVQAFHGSQLRTYVKKQFNRCNDNNLSYLLYKLVKYRH